MKVCVARQPIFEGHRRLWAYELLYRNANGGGPGDVDGESMTAQVLVNSFMTMGIESVTAGQPAFINFTRDMLLGDYASLLPPESVVIEVLEDIEPDDEVLAACRKLKDDGYRLAMDDMVGLDPKLRPLTELTDIFKVDFLLGTEQQMAALPRALAGPDRRFLAEKVETEEVFERAKGWGYDLFQGYFFSKPQMIEGQDVPGYKLTFLRLLQQVNEPDLDFDELESIVKSDASLTYKLLKFINAPSFGWRHKIESIRHALVAIGQIEFRKWVSLLCLTGMGDDKPRELLVQAVVRAHVCEGLASAGGLQEHRTELFLVGLFSLFDAIVGRPVAEIVAGMPLSDQAKAALTECTGPYADVLDTARWYERGEWHELGGSLAGLGVSAEVVSDTYLAAVRRADEVFSVV